MFRRFNNLNLGYKINLGFAALVLVLLLVVGLILAAGHKATEQINLTVDVRVPTTLAAAAAQSNLLKMQAAVRGYLAVGDLKNIDDYNQAKVHFQNNLAQLKTLSTDWTNQQDVERLDRLIDTFAVWLPIPEKLFSLHDNPLENQPGLQIENVDIQPLNVALLERVDQLTAQLHALAQRGARPSGPAAGSVAVLLSELDAFRTSFEGMRTNLSAYAATGGLIFKVRYSAELVTNSHHFGQITQEMATLLQGAEEEQNSGELVKLTALLDQFSRQRTTILALSEKLFAAVEGEQSHLDLFLFQNQMEPKTDEMLTMLEALALGQQTLLQSELDDGKRTLADLRYQTLLGGVIVLLLGAAMVYIFRRNVAKPIHRLSNTAERIGAGDLHARATVETTDEIGHLAATFNRMTGQLSETFQALAQAKETAESANRAKSKFLASMSHELRTPLNGILGYAQIMQRNADLSPAQASALNAIQSNGEHLLAFISDILDLSKIEARKLELIPTQISLPDFVAELEQMYQRRAMDQGQIDFAVTRSPVLPTTLEADEKRLRQILLNLLENAFKFTEAGCIRLAIELISPNVEQHHAPAVPSTQKSPQRARIRFAVIDTGIGMAPESLHKIFRPFEQVGNSQLRAKGTGLGLAITQELVYAMDGTLSVTSRPQQGSTFLFEADFPAHWSPADATQQARVASPASSAQTVAAAPLNRTPTIDFVPPPALETATLLDMALKGELPKLAARLQQLAHADPRYRPFADTLGALIDAYAEEQIVELLRACQLSPSQPDALPPRSSSPRPAALELYAHKR